MRSLASEHLQEIENLIGSERQKREEIIKITMGSIFSGDAPNLRIRRIHVLTKILHTGSRFRYRMSFR